MRTPHLPIEDVRRSDGVAVDLDYVVPTEWDGVDGYGNSLPTHVAVEDGDEGVRGVDHVAETG
jgi:hypothetical protein